MSEHKPGEIFTSSATYPIHPAAEKFPLEQEKLKPLIEDIRANGLHDEIELLAEDGKLRIIDGRRRNEACKAAKVSCRYKIIETDSPGGYVWSKNGDTRRHLPIGLLVLIYVECEAFDLETQKAKERMKAGGGDRKSPAAKSGKKNSSYPIPRGQSRDLIGAQIGVSGFMVDQARRVSKKAIPEVKEAVRNDTIKMNKADAIARLPGDKQLDALKQATAQRKSSPQPRTNKPPCGKPKEHRKSRLTRKKLEELIALAQTIANHVAKPSRELSVLTLRNDVKKLLQKLQSLNS